MRVDAEAAPSRAAMVSWGEPVGDVCPTSHPIKAKLGSKVFRKPGAHGYETSRPDRCYASEGEAKRGGYSEGKDGARTQGDGRRTASLRSDTRTEPGRGAEVGTTRTAEKR